MVSPARKAPAKRPVRANSIRAEDLVDLEEAAYGELAEAVDALRMLSGRLKADGAKDAMDKTINSMIKYGRTRDALLADLRARIQVAGSGAAGNVTTACVEALETRVMGVLDHVNKKLTKQDDVLAKLAAPKTCEQLEDYKWTEVVKRPRGGSNKRLITPAGNAAPAIRPNKPPKTQRTRPLAVMVAKDDVNFLELIKSIRSKVDRSITGDSIAKMRKTTNGNLLIEINGGTDAAEAVKNEVARTLGPAAKVRQMMDEAPIEIRDLDEETTREEVLAAVSALSEANTARLVSLRIAYGETAVVVVPSVVARRICAVGRLRVGLVYARVRRAELPPRCLRCLAFGHLTRECNGADRSGKCLSCGLDGHFGRDCTASPEEVAAFKQSLAKLGRPEDRGNFEEAKAMAAATPAPDRFTDSGQNNRND